MVHEITNQLSETIINLEAELIDTSEQMDKLFDGMTTFTDKFRERNNSMAAT